MKIYIEGARGTTEWREHFRAAREQFVAALADVATSQGVTSFVACDEEGEQIPWVWSDAEFRNSGSVGTLEDAVGFARNMIGQGMCFAFGVEGGDRVRMWLTTFEAPVDSPRWPSGVTIAHDDVWAGVESSPA